MKIKLYRRHSAGQILEQAQAARDGTSAKLGKGEIIVLELGNYTISSFPDLTVWIQKDA